LNRLEEIFERTIIDDDAHFHLLRHFQKVNDEFLADFIRNSQYNKDDIKDQLLKAGSKFRYSFANNPAELIMNLAKEVDYKSFYISTTENRMEILIEFDPVNYPKGIGFDGVVAIRNLQAGERQLIEEIDRDVFTVKVIKVDKKKTWKLNLILFEQEDHYLIGTFFPGTYAPPFPNTEIHTDNLIKEYTSFWNDHVLIL